jgi:hypothetical protein
MQYVVKIETVDWDGNKKSDFKVFNRKDDAEKRFWLAYKFSSGFRPLPPRAAREVTGCHLYETQAVDIRHAVELAERGEAKLIHSSELSDEDLVDILEPIGATPP